MTYLSNSHHQIKVYGILDEMIIGGEIMETSKSIILGIKFFAWCSETNKNFIGALRGIENLE